MRKITEVLRLYHECGCSHREIATAIGSSPTTVVTYLRRAQQAGITYPLPADITDDGIDARLFLPLPPPDAVRSEPDWQWVHRELRKKSVTLDLLWQEYKSDYPDGYRYSWFCEQYRTWAGRLSVIMRQTHTPSEKLFVDYAGQTVPIIDGMSGEIRQAQLFVAVLGASSYTYAEATWSQALPDWIGSHVRTFEFMGGVPELVVPDNLKSGVKHPSFYDPELNPTYSDLAAHYGVAILPARAYGDGRYTKLLAQIAKTDVLVLDDWGLAVMTDAARLVGNT